MPDQRLCRASALAVDAQRKLQDLAEQIDRGLDDFAPAGDPDSEFLVEEDSMVMAVAEVIARSKTGSDLRAKAAAAKAPRPSTPIRGVRLAPIPAISGGYSITKK